MTNLIRPTRVTYKIIDLLCKMTDYTLKINDLLMTLNFTSLKHVTFWAVYNKTLRGIKSSRDVKAGQVSQAVRA